MHITKPFVAIRLYDPAIDRSKTNAEVIQRFARERDNALLAFLPGAVPVRFHLRRISRRLWDWVEAATGEAERQTRAFRAAVIRVEALPVEGARIDWQPALIKDQAGLDLAMTDAELERFAPADVYEIGSVAWVASFFPHDCAATWPLLPTSAQVWDQTLPSRSAAAIPSGAVPSSAEPKAQPEQTAARSGDAPTVAIAVGEIGCSAAASTSPPAEGPPPRST